MEAIEKIMYKSIEISTFYDTDSESPDYWGNDDCFLVYDHRQFSVSVKGFEPEDIFSHISETKRLFYDGFFVFPVYAYIHSGISLSLGRDSYPFTCPWDTSLTGCILVKREKGAYTRKKAMQKAEGILNTWNEFLSGDVYGYNSEYGSCWGFYGSEGYKIMIEEAKMEIDYAQKQAVKNHLNQLKAWIKNSVPIEKRKSFQFA